MLTRIVDWALDSRWLVLAALLALVLTGGYVLSNLPIDAFPDLTNNQVVVVTECPSMSSTEVDELVTYPIQSALAGMPHIETVRSISKLGLSMITVIFDDSFDQYLARQLVAERLQEVRPRLPRNLQPALGPMATAFGEVYQYTLESRAKSLMDIKTFQDWTLRYALRSVPGVSEVNAWGGQSKQYAIQIDPIGLRRYGLTVHDVIERVAGNNSNFGGGYIEHAEQQYTIRGLGRASGPGDLENTVLLAHDGVPVLLEDVAAVATAPLLRYGATLRDTHEAVSATAIALKGENGRAVIDRIKTRLAQIHLPEGYRLRAFYDQSQIINGTINTVLHNLLEAGLLVTVILLLFLGDLRAAIIVAAMIPLSILFGFIGMAIFGVTANLMSLGAIDFGMIVDGSVVMIENSVHHLEKSSDKRLVESIRTASHEVARPILFGVAIIIAVYLPIFTLQGLEGRMFRPMAITVCSALLGSLILALTAVPALSTYFLRDREVKRNRISEIWHAQPGRLRDAYARSLDRASKHRAILIGLAVILVAAAITSLRFIGTEFMPKLDEGSIVITSRKLPGIALSESIDISKEIAGTIRSFPEVVGVVTKLGRPDVATEAMGIYESDSYLQLAPRNEWKCCHNKEELIEKLSEALQKIPGVTYNFTQPMEMRLDETVTGVRGDVAIKIFGDDLKTLEDLGKRVLALISSIPGAAEPQMEVLSGVAELQVNVTRPALARYGLNVSDVEEVVETLVGGRPLSEMIEGQARFPISVRLPERLRNDPEALKEIVLRASGSELVKLNQVAQVRTVLGPEVISRENARRRVAVQTNVRGTDLGSFVRLAQERVNSSIKLPPSYEIEWGGQFENQSRANRRLTFVLPVSVAIIFALLFATFHSLRQASLILLNVPFALVGGIGALWVRGLNLNLSASVGFIALFGVAVLNGIVLVSYINSLRQRGLVMEAAIREGAADRLRPVLITALVASIGFLPMAISTETGAEIQRPLATVVIGGLITSTLLTLYILPLLYPWFTPKAIAK
ncbi:MAG TPA: CusA/CzcA family heavy metal efflux RND transporter [Bryobacteraceae bacterium]|nr:CusA/CzcA family heavy metal efflux RND transporter [Bryobacteraceae bacterium]